MKQHEVTQAFGRHLDAQGLTTDGVRQHLGETLPGARSLPEGLSQADIRAAIQAGVDGAWRPVLYGRGDEPGIAARTASEVTRGVVGSIPKLAEAGGLTLAEACLVVRDVVQREQGAAEQSRNRVEQELRRVERRTDRALAQEQPAGGGVFGWALGAATQTFDNVQLRDLHKERERQARRHDIEDTQVNLWRDLAPRLEALPGRLVAAREYLEGELRDAALFASPAGATPVHLDGVTFEPVEHLVAYFGSHEAAPELASELLYALATEQTLPEVGAFIRTRATHEPARVPLANALSALHGDRASAVGKVILKVAMTEVRFGKEQLIYQVGERVGDAEAEIATLWPALPAQTGVVAMDGPASFLGWIFFSPPQPVAHVRRGTAVTDAPVRTPLAAPPDNGHHAVPLAG